jgi:hypothetical protein
MSTGAALESLLELAQICSMEKRPVKPRDDNNNNNKWTNEENELLTRLAIDGSLTW